MRNLVATMSPPQYIVSPNVGSLVWPLNPRTYGLVAMLTTPTRQVAAFNCRTIRSMARHNTKQRLARCRIGHGCVVRGDRGERIAASGERRRPFGRLRLFCAHVRFTPER